MYQKTKRPQADLDTGQRVDPIQSLSYFRHLVTTHFDAEQIVHISICQWLKLNFMSAKNTGPGVPRWRRLIAEITEMREPGLFTSVSLSHCPSKQSMHALRS